MSDQESERRIELVHESLVRQWPRLMRWRAQDEEGAVLRDQLRQAAQLWDQHGRAEDYLWTGTAFREYQLWRERYAGGLSTLEEDFAAAMTGQARRRTRRRRIAMAVVISSLAIGLAAMAALWHRGELSRRQAVAAREQAEEETLRAEASKLLALAELRLQDDPTEALAFTIASLEKADSQEARRFVMKALWEAPPALELAAESKAVRVPQFSPNGRWLATAGNHTEALVWSADGRGPVVLPGHEASARRANAPTWASNELLLTGLVIGGSSRVHLWSLPEGRRVRTIEFGARSWWQVARGGLFAETSEGDPLSEEPLGDLLLRSWALPDGEPVVLGRVDLRQVGARQSVFGPAWMAWLRHRAFAPDGASWLYVKGRELHARPLPVGAGPDHLLARLERETSGFEHWTHPDRLLLFDASGKVGVWSFPPGGPVRQRTVLKPDTASQAWCPEPSGRWVANYPELMSGRQLNVWALGGWRSARPLALRRSGPWSGALSNFHPTGDWVVTSTARMNRLTFWPLKRRYPLVVDGDEWGYRSLAFSPDSRWLATSWGNGRLRLWPVAAGDGREVELPYTEVNHITNTLAFDPGIRYLFAAGGGGNAWIVPLDGTAPRKLEGYSADIGLRGAAVSPSGRRVASARFFGQGENTLCIWEVESGDRRCFELPESQTSHASAMEMSTRGAETSRTTLERAIQSLAFAGESTLYTAGDGGLRRWDLETGAHELVIAASPGYLLAGDLAVDAGIALTAELPLDTSRVDECRQALLTDLATGASRRVTELGECHTWGLGRQGRPVAIDESGTVAATGSVDGIVRVGRLGEEPHLLVGHRGAIASVAISPDLRWVATSGEDNTLRLWPMPDLSKPPLHTLPYDELLAKLKSLTNLRVVEDPSAPNGYSVDVGPFPGWAEVPEW